MKKLIICLVLLISSICYSQELPLNVKEWYGIGTPGTPPDTSNYTVSGVAVIEQAAYMMGAVNAAGNVCFPTADANCRLNVALAGGLGDVAPMDGAAILVTANGMYVISGTYGWSTTSNQFVHQVINETLADNEAITNAMHTASVLYAWDGAAYDRLQVGAVGELEATDVATRPGEDAVSDWRKVKKEETASVTPAKSGPTAVNAVAAAIIASREIINDVNWCVWLRNAGGGGGAEFTDADVQVSPDGTNWLSLTWGDCDTLASGNICQYCVSGNAYRYVRVYVTAAAAPNDSTAEGWYTANKG